MIRTSYILGIILLFLRDFPSRKSWPSSACLAEFLVQEGRVWDLITYYRWFIIYFLLFDYLFPSNLRELTWCKPVLVIVLIKLVPNSFWICTTMADLPITCGEAYDFAKTFPPKTSPSEIARQLKTSKLSIKGSIYRSEEVLLHKCFVCYRNLLIRDPITVLISASPNLSPGLKFWLSSMICYWIEYRSWKK